MGPPVPLLPDTRVALVTDDGDKPGAIAAAVLAPRGVTEYDIRLDDGTVARRLTPHQVFPIPVDLDAARESLSTTAHLPDALGPEVCAALDYADQLHREAHWRAGFLDRIVEAYRLGGLYERNIVASVMPALANVLEQVEEHDDRCRTGGRPFRVGSVVRVEYTNDDRMPAWYRAEVIKHGRGDYMVKVVETGHGSQALPGIHVLLVAETLDTGVVRLVADEAQGTGAP